MTYSNTFRAFLHFISYIINILMNKKITVKSKYKGIEVILV